MTHSLFKPDKPDLKIEDLWMSLFELRRYNPCEPEASLCYFYDLFFYMKEFLK